VQHHWGGGTPTHLLTEQVRRLFRGACDAFPLAPGAEVSIEVDPRVTSDAHVEALRECGFDREVDTVQKAFKESGFKAAAAAISDEYMDQMPVIAATSVEEVRDRLQPFLASGLTRLSMPYVPAQEPNSEDALRFIEGWRRTAR